MDGWSLSCSPSSGDAGGWPRPGWQLGVSPAEPTPPPRGAWLPARWRLRESICGGRDCCSGNRKEGLASQPHLVAPGQRGEAGGDDMETWGLMRGRKAVQARQVSEVRGLCRREQPARGAQPGVPVGVAVFLDDGPVLSSQKSERGLQERHLPSAPRGGSGAGQPTTQLCLSAVFKVRGKGLFVSSGKTYRIPETDT